MPCRCGVSDYEMSEVIAIITSHAKAIVLAIKELERLGDPTSDLIADVKKTIDHLYTGKCDEKNENYGFIYKPPENTNKYDQRVVHLKGTLPKNPNSV
jgi:hypothetical protein